MSWDSATDCIYPTEIPRSHHLVVWLSYSHMIKHVQCINRHLYQRNCLRFLKPLKLIFVFVSALQELKSQRTTEEKQILGTKSYLAWNVGSAKTVPWLITQWKTSQEAAMQKCVNTDETFKLVAAGNRIKKQMKHRVTNQPWSRCSEVVWSMCLSQTLAFVKIVVSLF